MARTITSANAVLILTIPGVFDSGVRIQGFATDDIFGTDPIATTEARMGVDGNLAAGKIFNPVKMKLHIEANSPSVDVFEAWNAAEEQLRETISCTGTLEMPGVGKSFDLTNGYLTSFKSLPDAKKTAQPVEHEITWERVQPAPI